MALAARTAAEVDDLDIGERIGAVVVKRKMGVKPVVLAAAGDARWCRVGLGETFKKGGGNGNVMAHAVMRVIGMVAHKRRTKVQSLDAAAVVTDGTEIHEKDIFKDRPLTDVERFYYAQPTVAPNQYLCVDLEIYVTHEPCVMCSMAINHSRFGKVVFGRGMPRSGGLSSGHPSDKASEQAEQTEESGSQSLGYGLFWRPGLNWKLLAWRWDGADDDGTLEVREDIHV